MIGDIVILKKDASLKTLHQISLRTVYQNRINGSSIFNMGNFELKKGQKFEITKIISSIDGLISSILEIKSLDYENIIFEPNMYYFLSQNEYIKTIRENKLEKLGV